MAFIGKIFEKLIDLMTARDLLIIVVAAAISLGVIAGYPQVGDLVTKKEYCQLADSVREHSISIKEIQNGVSSTQLYLALASGLLSNAEIAKIRADKMWNREVNADSLIRLVNERALQPDSLRN